MYRPISALVVLISLCFVSGCSDSTSPQSPTAILGAPATIEFGNVRVGLMRDTSVRLSNTGTDTLRISGHHFSNSDFRLSDNSKAAINIAPGGYADVAFRYAPTSNGSMSGADTVISNTKGGSTVILLHGGPIAITRLAQIASTIDFGNVRVGVCADPLLGSPSDTLLQISNVGNDTLRIQFVTPQASNVIVLSVDSAIAPNGTGALKLRFCSPGLGATNTQVTIATNATQYSVQTITVSGMGVRYYPLAGSQYSYDAVQLDSNGHPIGNPYVITQTILASGLSYQGKSNVVETSDSTYFRIEDNGDVSVYSVGFQTYPPLNMVGSGWITIPFETHGAKMQVLAEDKDFTDSAGKPITLKVRDSVGWIETSTVTAAGRSFTTSRGFFEQVAVYSDGTNAIGLITASELFFSPEIGFVVQQNNLHKQVVFINGSPSVTGGGEGRRLRSYNLK
jgi:hypothetical protein